MARDAELPPIPLPRRLDRRMRLGPFPSARAAMKFAGYAAAGAVVVPIGGALAWLPILSLAFLLAVVRPDDKGLDERAHDYVRWRWRRHRRPPRSGKAPNASGADAFLRLPGPFVAAVLEADGVPIRFLPPNDARDLFDRYRDLLRSVESGFHLDVGTRPIGREALRIPGPIPSNAAEAAARAGYEEMAKLLLAHRRVRRVRVLLFESLRSSASLDRLEARARSFAAGLAGMGVRSERLRGRPLLRAAEAMGWSPEGSA